MVSQCLLYARYRLLCNQGFHILTHVQLEVSDIDPRWGIYDSHNRCSRRVEIHKVDLPDNLSNYALFLVLMINDLCSAVMRHGRDNQKDVPRA